MTVSREDRGDVAILWIDHPPVNALSRDVRQAIAQGVTDIGADPSITCAVLACRGRTFVAGADIREFGKPPLAPPTFEVAFVIEASHKPIVAAIHGTALGGGCELALACHARVATATARLGLPEVTLGILPGGGGTIRLPRAIDPLTAIDMIGSGRPVDAVEALAIGLIDEIADADVVDAAIIKARSRVGQPMRRLSTLTPPPVDPADARARLSAIEKKARGQISPGVAARVALENLTSAFADGQARERRASLELVASEQAFALRHVFFAEREAAKVPFLEGATPRTVERVGVVGAGAMGAGIAVALADAGYQVLVVERDAAAATAGQARVSAMYDRAIKSGRLDETGKNRRLSSMTFAFDLAALTARDLVIEAVYDDLEIKRTLFQNLSQVVGDDCVLATNTSYLDINAIAGAATNPGRFVGMHFFAPANVMKLLEVSRADATSPETLATAFSVGRKLKKSPIFAGAREGFIGNRILAVYRAQCEYLLEEGATPREIDDAIEALGLAMGPFAAADLSGLEISWARRKRLAPMRDPRERYVAIADLLCERGRLGVKSNAGWYRYEDGKRFDDPVVLDLVEQSSRDRGLSRRAIARAEIQARVIAAMANEGARILDEGAALRAGDIDLVFINGFGWPRWLGGPMFQADRRGLRAIVETVRDMEKRDGFGWSVAPLLARLADNGETFAGARIPPSD